MKKQITCLILALMMSTQTLWAQQLSDIHMDNEILAECVSFRKKALKTHNNNIFLEIDIIIGKPIGHCGCKSMLMAYWSWRMIRKHSNALKSGTILVREAEKTVTIPIFPAPQGNARQRNYHVSFSCAAPD
ncbi:MAG: DUF2195 family protein [Methyloligellaceae bacterium]